MGLSSFPDPATHNLRPLEVIFFFKLSKPASASLSVRLSIQHGVNAQFQQRVHTIHTPSLGGIIAESLAVKSTDSGDLGSSPSSTTLQLCDSGQ